METIKLTRNELIAAVWQKTGIDKRDVTECYENIIETIKQALERQIVVELRGFGTFSVRIRQGRKNALNPKTREFVPSRPHGICMFKPGIELKRNVWKLDASREGASGEAPPGEGGGGFVSGGGSVTGGGFVSGNGGGFATGGGFAAGGDAAQTVP